MITDRQGNRLSGATADAVALFDEAVLAFNRYRGDPLALLDQAVAAAPAFTMAHLLKAYLLAVATEPAATAEARTIVERTTTLATDEREASHRAAVALILDGEWSRAALALDRHLIRHPRDLVALQVGHLLDFYRTNPRNLRDRIARALPHWSEDVAGYSFVLGFYAFGLEETGDYGRAEEMGRQATDLEPLDCWAHHAVAHVMEMQGRAQDGIGWMITREPTWSGDDNFFKVHNWWHRALFHLDLGEVDQVLALYDGPIRQDRSAVAFDIVDASALLWRLHLTGADAGDRWQELADAWEPLADGRLYPFNDWHAVMAWLGAGRDEAVDRLIARWRQPANGSEAAGWCGQYGLPLVEGFAAFWRGDYATTVDRLHPARFIANGFGGSAAQRDIIDWTLTEAAVRGGMTDVAEALAHERLALKPHSPINRAFLARGRAGAGADVRPTGA